MVDIRFLPRHSGTYLLQNSGSGVCNITIVKLTQLIKGIKLKNVTVSIAFLFHREVIDKLDVDIFPITFSDAFFTIFLPHYLAELP